jgi:hypothetical protein
MSRGANEFSGSLTNFAWLLRCGYTLGSIGCEIWKQIITGIVSTTLIVIVTIVVSALQVTSIDVLHNIHFLLIYLPPNDIFNLELIFEFE